MQSRSVHITRREWRNVLLFTLLIIVLTTLPYAMAYLKQNNQWTFSGFLFGVEDGNSYVGKMRLGARGLMNFYLFYTPEPHAAAPLVFLPYILPGWLVGRFINDHNPMLVQALTLTYHLMQIVFYTQFTQHGSCITFGCIATHFSKIMLQFPGLEAIRFCKIRFCINGIPLVHQFPHFFVAHQYGI